MNTWRENPDRRQLDMATEEFEPVVVDGVTVAALPTTQDIAGYEATGFRAGDRSTALASSGAVPKWKAIAMHPATWVVGAVLLGYGLRKALKR